MRILYRVLGFAVAFPIAFFILGKGAFVLSRNTAIVGYKEPAAPYEGVGVYVINMEKSVDRAERIFPLVAALGYPVERIEAVDGSALSEKEIAELAECHTVHRWWMRGPLSKGELGCSLSHMKTWYTFLESPYAYALIFEDDTVFEPSALLSVVQRTLAYSNKWDICSFQINCEKPYKDLVLAKLSEDEVLFSPIHPLFFAGAYIINRKAAKRYLQKALPIAMPLDAYLYRAWEFSQTLVAVTPSPTYQWGESEIDRMEKRSYGGHDGFLLMIEREIFQIKTYLMRHLYGIYVWATFGGTSLWPKKSVRTCKKDIFQKDKS